MAKRTPCTLAVILIWLSWAVCLSAQNRGDIKNPQATIRVKVFGKYNGATVIVADPLTHRVKYLGTIEDEYSSESIFNPYGRYGNEYSKDSIWNEYGSYGGASSINSPFNEYSTFPPAIVKNGKTIGHLTINKFVQGDVDPNWLKMYFTKP
jgi:hypothetical protein